MLALPAPNLQLPWSSSIEQDRQFWKFLLYGLIPFLIISLMIPFINVPEPKREDLEKLPPQLARVVLEKKELPKPPPPPPPKKEEKKKEEKKPEPEKKKEEKKPEPKKEEPKKPPEPAKLKQEAQEKAKKSGLLQFQDDLMAMRDSLDVSEVSNANLTRAQGKAAQVDRNIISSGAKASSGGINTASLSRNTGGVALSGRETTQVESKIKKSASAESNKAKGGSRNQSYRSDEAIRKVMDQNKGAVFAIYNRALRKNPSLEGKVVFKLIIDPSGQVVDAQIVSSELNDPSLERKLLSRIRLINFGATKVLRTTLNYSFDFLPY